MCFCYVLNPALSNRQSPAPVPHRGRQAQAARPVRRFAGEDPPRFRVTLVPVVPVVPFAPLRLLRAAACPGPDRAPSRETLRPQSGGNEWQLLPLLPSCRTSVRDLGDDREVSPIRPLPAPPAPARAVAGRAWRKRWVRVLAILAAIPIILYAILWLLFARGLPSAESLLSYEPVLPTYVRDVDGAPVQAFARERRVQLAYEEFPVPLINAFLAAEDRT